VGLKALNCSSAHTAKKVTGQPSEQGVRLDLATYEKVSTFDQRASEGFIKIFGLPTVLSMQVAQEAAEKREKV
jgi:argininosuccinate synthase